MNGESFSVAYSELSTVETPNKGLKQGPFGVRKIFLGNILGKVVCKEYFWDFE